MSREKAARSIVCLLRECTHAPLMGNDFINAVKNVEDVLEYFEEVLKKTSSVETILKCFEEATKKVNDDNTIPRF